MQELLARARRWYTTADRKKKIQAGLIILSLAACLVLFFSTGSPAQNGDPLEGSSFYFAGVIVKLVGVLLLFVGGAAVLMRWAKNPRRGGSLRQMVVVESVRLSPKQALHLVRVGGKHWMVGATDQGISLVSAVEVEEPALSEESSPPIPVDFGQLLRGFVSQNPNTPTNP